MRKLKLQELNRPTVKDYKAIDKIDLVIVLDNLRSGNNIGSVFRTADCVGVKELILTGISQQPPHKEITKTAIGATSSVDWQYFESNADAISYLKQNDYKVFAVEQTTDSIDLSAIEIAETDKIAIVLGNEVQGVSDDMISLVDGAIEIAQYGTKHSFNVSVCAGIVAHTIASKLR